MTDDARSRAVARFVDLVASGEPPLDAAALEIAVAAQGGPAEPDPRPAALAELDRLAAGIGDVDALLTRLYAEEGFAGNTEEYYDPANSSLLELLRRRRGIPISLAVLVVEVGRRAGIAMEPVGMPGHFLVHPVGSAWHIDPFTGELLDADECEARFRAATGAGPAVAFGPELLTPVTPALVLVRMLTNLRAIHRAAGRLRELGWVLEMRLALPGVTAAEVLELAEVRGRRAQFGEAGRLLDTWAGRLPGDAARLRRLARSWRAHLN